MANAYKEDKDIFNKTINPIKLPHGGDVTLEYLKLKVNEKKNSKVKSNLINKYLLSNSNEKFKKSSFLLSQPKTMVVILPGVTGNSDDGYVIRIFAEILSRFECEIVVYLSRFNGKKFTFSNKGFIDLVEDFHHAILHLKSKHPDYTFYGFGHSYGAIQLVNYLGTFNKENIIKGAISLSNPLNLILGEANVRGIICNKVIAKSIKEMAKRHIEVLKNAPKKLNIKIEEILAAKTLRPLDEAFFSKLFGYDNVDEYYLGTSGIRKFKDIKIPLFILNALDDPFITEKAYPLNTIEQINDNIILMVSKKGGHLGWFTGLIPRRWYIQPCVKFLTFLNKSNKVNTNNN